jgi:hypothetical protein
VVQRLGKSYIRVWTPSLLMHLVTQVTSLDTSSVLLKRFPWSGFFNFENKSKSGGLPVVAAHKHKLLCYKQLNTHYPTSFNKEASDI